MSADRTPPHDLAAEQALLGICLDSGRMPPAVDALQGSDFYRPGHEVVWEAMRHCVADGRPCDTITVRGWLQQTRLLSSVGGEPYLIELTSTAPVVASASHYAAIVTERAHRRSIIQAATTAEQDAYESADDAADIAARAEAGFAKAVPVRETRERPLNLDDFLAQELPPLQWVVPDLLARGERLVLTGYEGLGKSVLMRQMLVCASAGMNPFSGVAAQPATCMLVDCENPKRIMMNVLDKLRSSARSHGFPPDPTRLIIVRRPEGLDLGQAAERLWLNRLVGKYKPDLLAIGPAYKMHMGGGSGAREEDLARQVASTIDHLREQHDCAVILEHHSPHASPGVKTRAVRPIGSSLWLRWPEFGLGLCWADAPDAQERRLVDVVPWRGGREERPWPHQLASGGSGFPWVETENSYPMGRAA